MLQWVKGIVFYLILLTVVSHLIPGHKYDKYVRLFTGMLLIMIVIRPVMHLFSWDSIFDKHFLSASGEDWGIGLDEEFMQDLEGVQSEQMQEEYEKQAVQFVTSQAQQFGLAVTRCEAEAAWKEDALCLLALYVEVREWGKEASGGDGRSGAIGQVTVAEVVLEGQQAGGDYEPFRNALAQYYGIEKEQIQIRGQG